MVYQSVHYVPECPRLSTIMESAVAAFKAAHPRAGEYGPDCIRGGQRWSGADLAGKARRFSGSYLRVRLSAQKALYAAGGSIVPGPTRRLETALYLGMDDYGNAIYSI